jgi:hypothetical protein
VARRLPVAGLAVVHGRQIIVNERVGMQKLDRARRVYSLRDVAAETLAYAQHEGRPQAFAASHKAVAHRLGETAHAASGDHP